ncbi:MAG: ATP-grasp domain-containing protein, partial [Acidimicrobiia bacterium]|nr:ATP-grasp domain-containing protein [Acidimicrobiia bacterium]
MMLQESIPLGLDLRFLVSSPDDPVAQVSAYCSVGSPTSPADLERFAHTVDVMTFDHEVVDLAALEHLEANGHLLAPDAASFATVSDKARMRAALTSAGIPVPEAVVTEDAEHISRLVAARGPQVLKVAHGGYDGRGTFFVDDPAEASRIASVTDGPLLVEPRLDLIAELAAIVVIGRDGGRVGYDPVLTIQVEGQCRRIDAPAALSDEIIESARELAGAAAEAVGATGVVATELFLTSEGLLV